MTFAPVHRAGARRGAARRSLANPPDILLTNYVMLELILTRPDERQLVQAAQGLRFLVLDELHTYRGRQGADVALLVRRAREACGATALQRVGTSATIAGPAGLTSSSKPKSRGSRPLLFGAEVEPGDVIGETLRASDRRAATSTMARSSLPCGSRIGSGGASAGQLRSVRRRPAFAVD